MKKFLKINAVFAALVLALACFVACSNGSSDGNINNNGNNSNNNGNNGGEGGNEASSIVGTWFGIDTQYNFTYNYKFTSDGRFVFEEIGKDYIGDNAKIRISGTYEYNEITGFYKLFPEHFSRNSTSTGNTTVSSVVFYGMVSGGKLYFNPFFGRGSYVLLHEANYSKFLFPETSPIEEGDWYDGYFTADYDTKPIGLDLAFNGINSLDFEKDKRFSFFSDGTCKYYQGRNTIITYTSYAFSDNKLTMTNEKGTETYNIIMHSFDFSKIKEEDLTLVIFGKEAYDLLILKSENYLTKVKE